MNTRLARVPSAFLRLLEFEQLRFLLSLEIRQSEEEGFAVADLAGALERQTTKTELVGTYNKLLNAPGVEEFKFNEPETLAGIRTARPDGPRLALPELDPAALYDRIYGGWLGRVAGCVLGKPVEPFGDREKIIRYLKLANSYPLSDYIPLADPLPAGFPIDPHAGHIFRAGLHGAPDDDDTDYTVLGLHILETCGLDFTTGQVAAEWLSHLAYHKTYTAERAAYRNLVLGIPPDEAARLLNPEREYIGARIRVDAYGMAAPGNPELAAGLAFQDASLSHTKNGIYSAMFMAACIAWAFVADDPVEIVRAGLSEIPETCRLAEAVRDVLALRRKTGDWENAYSRLLAKYGRYHPVHAINNTAWMVLAMLYGEGDFERTICTAVLCGFDTDCNAANAGTVLGILAGAHALPHKWSDPLEDTLHTALGQFGQMRISDLARRTALIAEKTLSIHRKGE